MSFLKKRECQFMSSQVKSVRDVIEITTREYCGAGKPYKSVLILFDEFGKYTELLQ
jgi:hypothetical protein